MRINCDFFSRKKNVDSLQMEETKLNRVLNTFDLTMLGIGCTFGSGVYVLIGNVISKYSGPAIIFSFIVAGIATFLSGMSYAELGSRVPRSGSAYVYIYVTIGEFIAFIIGWDLILEYMIGSAGTANALSQYINSLCDNKIKNLLRNTMPMNIHGLGPYPDFLAMAIILTVVGILIVGVKESAIMNRLFVCVNTFIILFIIVTGATKADTHNWHLNQTDFTSNWTYNSNSHSGCSKNANGCGDGGFLPYGFYGMIQGAAKCFYAYIGFDCIATTGEEVKNPLKALPLSILITLSVCTIAYLGVSVVITLMIPYFLIDTNAPFPSAFEYVHYDWARYIVAIGAVASLSTCLYSSMFPMPRVVYSIASDGLIFKFLSKVLPTVKTPALATLLTGILTAILAAIFDLEQLVEMTSIGTLLAYSLVSACVIILRYRPGSVIEKADTEGTETPKDSYIPIFGVSGEEKLWQKLFSPVLTQANAASAKLVNIFTILSIFDLIIICLILTFAHDIKQAWIITLLVIFALILFLFLFIIWRQPQNTNINTFKIPFVPLFPIISIFINIYLMMSLSLYTWIRFIVWFVIGFIVYFLYGIRNSLENKRPFAWFPCIETGITTLDEPSEDINLESQSIKPSIPE